MAPSDTTPAAIDEHPLVTFALFAYNQEAYIREAVEGAFSQTYEPLEIILSDDCSSDRTFEIMQEMAAEYKGPHTVRLRRPECNLGLATGVSEVSAMASGGLIVAAAGDDISVPHRTAKLVKAWIANDCRSGSIYSHYCTIDAEGKIGGPNPRNAYSVTTLADRDIRLLNNFTGLSGCAHAWTRDLFDTFGAIDSRIVHEDAAVPLRALLMGSITFLPLDLVFYRLTPGSITRRTYRTGKERIEKMARYWAGRITIFQQFYTDSRIAKDRNLTDSSDIAWLVGKAEQAENFAELTYQLYASAFSRRIAIIFNPNSKISLANRMKWALIAGFPWVYGRLT